MLSVPLVENPVIGAMVEAVHEKVVPATVAERLTCALVCPEQSVCSSGQLVTVGLGLTVTIWFTVFPGQPLKDEFME